MGNAEKTLIKWPGGKTREIRYIADLIPDFDRYVEPFFGGGAMFFHLKPKHALINDVSPNLIRFYRLVQAQDREFERHLRAYDESFQNLLAACDRKIDGILRLYSGIRHDADSKRKLSVLAAELASAAVSGLSLSPVLNMNDFTTCLEASAWDKMRRTAEHESRSPFSEEDLKENLITGFTGGYYLYFRDVYNCIARDPAVYPNEALNTANFYFIREYCYGSMFRYNSKGNFNIPYGGMTYNRKDFGAKIDRIFSEEIRDLFSDTEISCSDFSDFITGHDLKDTDFMFLDPPYDTDFSDYEGRAFQKDDQKRLSDILKQTRAKFILVIKNTDYIRSLYEDRFRILSFDKTYTYNMRSRNDRKVEHLIITNIEMK